MYRMKHEWSQNQVARLCGISQQTYAAVELGKRNPSVEAAKRIGAALGFPWTRFFDEEE